MVSPSPYKYAKLLLALYTGRKENSAKKATMAQMARSPFKFAIMFHGLFTSFLLFLMLLIFLLLLLLLLLLILIFLLKKLAVLNLILVDFGHVYKFLIA